MRTATLPHRTDERTRLRLTIVGMLVLSVFVILIARLWYIQIVAGERYAAQAERNRVRVVTLEAPRGRILDRAGRVLVDNRQVHVLAVRVDDMGDRRETVLSELARLLGVDVAEMRRRIAEGTQDPVRPVPIAFDVPERIALFVWEHQSTRFPGVSAELVPRRSYPHGELAAHVLGYTGEITSELLDDPVHAGARPGDQVGMAGVERSYERTLRGVPGRRELEIDATGDVVRQISERLPVPGADLRLTIDLEVQRLTERALAEGLVRARRLTDPQGRGNGRFAAPAGAAVVLDARTGALRAVVSHPTYAPEAFVGGIAADDFAALVDPAAHAPLVNRVVQSTYPPGSVFKIASAAAALRHGFATDLTTFPCPATWRWSPGGEPFRNWTSADLGDMTLAESLTQSCDTVYYELAKRMWESEERDGASDELLGLQARAFGFGSATGVDLPGERDGLVPGRRWRRRTWEANRDGSCRQARQATAPGIRRLLTELCGPDGAHWRGGDAVNMAIGQGDVLASPLQVAAAMAAVANTEAVPRPHIGAGIQHAGAAPRNLPVPAGTALDLDPAHLDVIRRGLEGVTAPGGTAADAFAGAELPVAGKTGTAEAGAEQPFAWFAGYGPTTAARHVVVVMIEQGGNGSRAAAPVAREIFAGLSRDTRWSLRPGDLDGLAALDGGSAP